MNDTSIEKLINIIDEIPLVILNRVIGIYFKQNLENRKQLIRAIQREFGPSELTQKLLDFINSDADITSYEIGIVLKTTQISRSKNSKNNMQLVWSGPLSKTIPMRKTEQVIIEMIDNANSRLFISSFALYKAKDVLKHLELSIGEGVKVSILLETPQSSHHKIDLDPLEILPRLIQENAEIFIWPYKNRTKIGDKYTGTIHAKFIIQDDKKLFISSANLTESAFERNIELGVLIEDKKIVRDLNEQLQQLILNNVITKI